MQAPRHHLLADTGFALDQYRERGRGDRLDIRQQPLHRRTSANNLGGRQLAIEFSRHLVTVFQLLLQLLDTLDRGHDGAGEADGQLLLTRLDAVKLAGADRVQGDHAPGLLIDVNRNPHAIVYVQATVGNMNQAVVGVGQLAIHRKPNQFATAQDGFQPRVLAEQEPAAAGFFAQAIEGHRPQVIALQPQQADGVAGNGLANRFQQAPIADLGGQVTTQVLNNGDVVFQSHAVKITCIRSL